MQKTYSDEAGHIESISEIFKVLTDKIQGWKDDSSLEGQSEGGGQLFQFVDYMNHELDTYVDLIILGQHR